LYNALWNFAREFIFVIIAAKEFSKCFMTEEGKLRFVSSRIRRDVTSKLCNLLNPNFVQSGVLNFRTGISRVPKETRVLRILRRRGPV